MLIYDKKTGTLLDARHCVFIDNEGGDCSGVDFTPEDWIIAAEDCLPVVTAYNAHSFITERLPDLILYASRDTDGNVLDPWEF